MTYYTVYKVTNRINGKFYIGTHKTQDLNDNYMGSGKYLNHAINKHGIENFDKEILHVFDNPEDMFAMEAEIVNEDFLAEENTYNLKVGGFGGWDYINSNETLRKEKNLRAAKSTHERYSKEVRSKWTKDSIQKRINKHGPERIKEIAEIAGQAMKKRLEDDPELLKTYSERSRNFRHSNESKRKIGLANSIKNKGKGNPHYGTRWIYSLEEKKSKRIPKTDPLPKGWYEGRKIKF